jgi:hypothetical protein
MLLERVLAVDQRQMKAPGLPAGGLEIRRAGPDGAQARAAGSRKL